MEHIIRIIRGCREKNYKYQKIVYEQYYGFALNTVFRYIYHYEKAVDVVNDGFVKLFTHFNRFSSNADEQTERMLMAWLKKIMINTAIDELRKNKMIPEIGGIPDYLWEQTSNNQDADQLLLYKDIIIMIKALPPSYRTIFNLYVIDGYTHLEIASMLNISVGTSKSGLSRARVLLQKRINKLEEEIYAIS
ncbi:MAG: RNA polymerase sigma factor [Sphingobacteriales bacterium]